MKAFPVLFRTEAKLALRGGDMLFFGVLFPVGVMLLVGFISNPEAARLGFGGIASIGICASGLMGLPLTLSGYRHAKILKRLKVTPVSPAQLLLAVSGVQAVFAAISGLAVYLIARFAFGIDLEGTGLRYILTFAFVLVSIFSLGYLIASLVPDTKTANIVCTVLYFPMLFLSGATLPYEIMPRGLQVFAEIFPLTQGIKLLKGAVLGTPISSDFAKIAVLAGLAVVSYFVSLLTFRWE
ncbi:MAG TPA: ABC transporter permease [Rectinemataceae bacterium]|nr:ABC transporter permease [Rectinemataceae bacterium]